jgi:hypothetical protein
VGESDSETEAGVIIPRWLKDLAERKLGKDATVRVDDGEWVAERVSRAGRTRVTGRTRDTLVWFLEQMPDVDK